MTRLRNSKFMRLGILLTTLTLLGGCAEQPYGYIFEPTQRDQINVARQAANFISALYDHADQATALLEKAGLTDEYSTILPEGWVDITPRDSLGLPRIPYYRFFKNYLDKQFTELQIDVVPLPGAMRSPSSLRYNYSTTASIRNEATNIIYGTIDQVQKADIRYSDNLQNLKFVDGWYSISKSVPFDQEIEIQQQGRSTNVTYQIYLNVGWSLQVERYSIDPNDQSSKIIIEGVFPILDDEGVIQRCHVSGNFEVNSSGKGGGDIWLYGRPTARISFTGRSFGFKGEFTLFSEEHENSYKL